MRKTEGGNPQLSSQERTCHQQGSQLTASSGCTFRLYNSGLTEATLSRWLPANVGHDGLPQPNPSGPCQTLPTQEIPTSLAKDLRAALQAKSLPTPNAFHRVRSVLWLEGSHHLLLPPWSFIHFPQEILCTSVLECTLQRA